MKMKVLRRRKLPSYGTPIGEKSFIPYSSMQLPVRRPRILDCLLRRHVMFCDQCGTPIQPDHRFCARCGKSVLAIATPCPSRFERHLHLLGILWIVAGALWLVPSFAFMTMSQAGHFGMWPVVPFHHVVFPPLMFGLGSGLLIVAAGGICIGWGLMRREPWARVAAIILGILALAHPPFGTALGIYTLWVLLSNNGGLAYDQVARR
jgi:hypothetical protein